MDVPRLRRENLYELLWAERVMMLLRLTRLLLLLQQCALPPHTPALMTESGVGGAWVVGDALDGVAEQGLLGPSKKDLTGVIGVII